MIGTYSTWIIGDCELSHIRKTVFNQLSNEDMGIWLNGIIGEGYRVNRLDSLIQGCNFICEMEVDMAVGQVTLYPFCSH